jgi:hypothetical protein
MYRRICIPLLQVNSNIYAFVSGILVSLATNIFAALCFKTFDLHNQWYHYLSTILFVIAGALCMYISVKVVDFQNYIATKNITSPKEKFNIINDATEKRKKLWVVCYSLFIILLVAGFISLGFSWVNNNSITQ